MRRLIATTLVIGLMLGFACQKELHINNPVLTAAVTPVSADADGFSKVTVTIKLTSTAIDSATRGVVVTTGAGKFLTAKGQEASTIIHTVPNEDFPLTLIVGKTAGDFDVKATLYGLPQYFVTTTLKLNELKGTDVLKNITLSPSSVSVSNKGVITGSLTVSKSKDNTVTLSTTESGALFVESGQATYSPQIPTDGNISFQLKTGSAPGNYFVTAALNDDRGFKVITPYAVTALASNAVLQINLPSDTSMRADGLSVITGTVLIKQTSLTTLTLKTTGGTFSKPAGNDVVTLNVDPAGSATFSLRAGNSVPPNSSGTSYMLSAEAAPYAVFWGIKVLPAYPTSVIIDPSSYTIQKHNGNVTFNVQLLRQSGMVSDGVQIAFDAYQDSLGVVKSVGRFTTIPAFSSGQKATAKLLTDVRAPYKSFPVTVKVSFVKDDGTTGSATVDLTVLP